MTYGPTTRRPGGKGGGARSGHGASRTGSARRGGLDPHSVHVDGRPNLLLPTGSVPSAPGGEQGTESILERLVKTSQAARALQDRQLEEAANKAVQHAKEEVQHAKEALYFPNGKALPEWASNTLRALWERESKAQAVVPSGDRGLAQENTLPKVPWKDIVSSRYRQNVIEEVNEEPTPVTGSTGAERFCIWCGVECESIEALEDHEAECE